MANDTPATALPIPGGGGAGGGTASTGVDPGSFGQGEKPFVHPRLQPNKLVVVADREDYSDSLPGDRLTFRAEEITGAWDRFMLEYTTEITTNVSSRTFYGFTTQITGLRGSGSRQEVLIYHATWRIRGWDVNGDMVVDTGWRGPN